MEAPRVQIVDAGIFVVAAVFTPGECQSLIQRAQGIGFEAATVRTAAGRKMMTQIRNNERVALDDPDLAQSMWERIQPFLPELDGSVATGIDPQLRFYRYTPGQQFKRHRDGAVINAVGQTSKLSYLVYLNDGCVGGETIFREYHCVNDVSEEIQFTVSPVTGAALLFRHERWHEGALVVSGEKYVLRSDVYYEPRG